MVEHCVYEIHQTTNQGIHPQRVEEYAHHATFSPRPKHNKQSKKEGIWRIGQHDSCSKYGIGIKPGRPGSGKGQTIYCNTPLVYISPSFPSLQKWRGPFTREQSFRAQTQFVVFKLQGTRDRRVPGFYQG
jgi:hypothetical protein